ncbi:MAG: shikimate kinase [Verrucomicrobia bacterium]|nr:MAG: shikimate kinase [Verrucomicrobiota bacterium]
MREPLNIVLFGFMGTGKSTVGRVLARKLGMDFVDMDTEIERRTAKTIPQIFAEDGEAHFRKLERDLVRELSRRKGTVIAAGGGVVLNPENVADFARNGLLVCLNASPETILQRVREESHRPLLEQGEKERRVREILEARRPYYGALPHQVETDNRTPDEIAEEIITLFRREERD